MRQWQTKQAELQLGEKAAQLLFAIRIAEIEDIMRSWIGRQDPSDDLNRAAVDNLKEGVDLAQEAAAEQNKKERKQLIDDAIAKLVAARDHICELGTDSILCPP